tara:strand:- start:159834 stop:160115 length:282 start_codon:yes stop_codon:yes gene_type:complete
MLAGIIVGYSYFHESEEIAFFYYLILWGIGVVNYGLNIYVADQLKLREPFFTTMIISGSFWVFPPLMFTYFGIPCMIVYLAIGIYLFSSKHNR